MVGISLRIVKRPDIWQAAGKLIAMYIDTLNKTIVLQ